LRCGRWHASVPGLKLRFELLGPALKLLEGGALIGKLVAKHELAQPLHRPVRLDRLGIHHGQHQRFLDAEDLRLHLVDGALQLFELLTTPIPAKEESHGLASDTGVRVGPDAGSHL
jgi:hypothetical protein